MSTGEISTGRRLYWSVRRELWENRSVYLAPLIVAGIVLVGFSISLFSLPSRMRAALTLGQDQLGATVQQPYLIVAIILMGIDLLVAILYCVDALYIERRDRSILFWRSLPVSDLMAVISKACIPILVLPLVTFLATVGTQGIMLLASSLVLTSNGMSVAPLWAHMSLFQIARINFTHLVGMHGLWYAPLYAWLLLASAWSTRVPFLWATLPPLALGIVERIAFGTSYFASLMQGYFLGGPEGAAMDATPEMTLEMLAPHPLGHFLSSPGLWAGLLLSAAFLVGAARLRRFRGPL